ncbi:MFS family permease [Paucibacter oligotrophus]|uniref:MFS family permease n=1 Tax=Roseateles oligotrophus TaxID=1769250 RepID=A0A840L3I2_9BURK|nr:MFS transporter [Roseateles oligotrophus]MBB4843064.1 MFS family permease [Roseateles oligotrophus]
MKTPAILAPQQRPVALLIAAQALYVCASAIGLTLTGLVGLQLAPSAGLATLPFALVTVATALSTIPVSLAMARWGRKPLFLLGCACGALGGGLAAWAIVRSSFALFCLACLLQGLFQASAQYYRFAATEVAAATFRSRAIAWVIGGGVLAALLGPGLAAWARDALAPHTFAGSYLGVLGAALLSALVLAGARMDKPAAPAAGQARPTPWLSLLRRPAFIAAAGNSLVSYAVMMFVMTATPLAVLGCGLGVGEAAAVIQWHLLAMFAPGFFSGRLIARWGVRTVLLLGAALFALGSAVALSGLTLPHFGLALALNGLAWNLMFVGGSTLLAQSFADSPPQDRARAQAANEFITFAAVAAASLLAGASYSRWGWETIQWLVLPWLALAALVTLWSGARSRRPALA